MEIYKADGSRLVGPIDLDKLDIFWPAEEGKKGWWEQ